MYGGETCFFSLNDIYASFNALHIPNAASSKKFGLVCIHKLDQSQLQTDIFHAVILQIKKIKRIHWISNDYTLIQTFDLVKSPIEYYRKIKELKALHLVRNIMES